MGHGLRPTGRKTRGSVQGLPPTPERSNTTVSHGQAWSDKVNHSKRNAKHPGTANAKPAQARQGEHAGQIQSRPKVWFCLAEEPLPTPTPHHIPQRTLSPRHRQRHRRRRAPLLNSPRRLRPLVSPLRCASAVRLDPNLDQPPRMSSQPLR